MAHGAAIAVEPVIGQNFQQPSDVSPQTIRWGIQCVDRDKYMDGYEVGVPLTFLPYANWFPIQTFDRAEEHHTTDNNPNVPRHYLRPRSAQDIQTYLEERYTNKDIFGQVVKDKMDKGMQVGFVGESNAEVMAVVSKTLIPALSKIRELAQEFGMAPPISNVCEGQDDLDYESRESCPTCWAKWINSDLCTRYIQFVAQNGLTVTDGEREWNVTPSLDLLTEAYMLTKKSLAMGVAYINAQWKIVADELSKGTRGALDAGGYQDAMRRDAHQSKPEDRQFRVLQDMAKAAQGGNNDDVLRMLAQSQMQTNALLGQLVASQGGITTNTAPPVVTASEPEAAFSKGDTVSADGINGTVVEVKPAGWVDVETESGLKTFRKNKLQKI